MGVCKTAAGVLVLAGVLSAGVPAGAQPPAFVRGEANASADSIGLRVQVGGANLGYTVGRSLAGYVENEATGEARAMDLEALPILLGEVGACPGVTPLIPNAALPPETLVESTAAGSTDSHRVEAFFPELERGPSTLSAGFQDAKASPQPWAWGSTETPDQDVGIFKVWQARTASTAQLTGRVRSATATMTADAISFLGGAFVLYEPTWTATARSGDQEELTATFTVKSGRLFGVPRTAAQARLDLSWFASSLQSLLGFVGVRLQLPQVIERDGGIEVTPLRFMVKDLPIGKVAISPLLDLFGSEIETYYTQLRDSGCKGKSDLQLLQLVEGILRGNGAISIPVGGATAATDDTYYPVASPDLAPPPSAPPSLPTDAGGGVLADVVGVPPLDPEAFDVGDLDVGTVEDPLAFEDTAAASTPVEATTTTEAADEVDGGIEEQASPVAARRDGGDTGGAGVVIGLLGILVAAALAFADRWSILRGRRRIIP